MIGEIYNERLVNEKVIISIDAIKTVIKFIAAKLSKYIPIKVVVFFKKACYIYKYE